MGLLNETEIQAIILARYLNEPLAEIVIQVSDCQAIAAAQHRKDCEAINAELAMRIDEANLKAKGSDDYVAGKVMALLQMQNWLSQQEGR